MGRGDEVLRAGCSQHRAGCRDEDANTDGAWRRGSEKGKDITHKSLAPLVR